MTGPVFTGDLSVLDFLKNNKRMKTGFGSVVTLHCQTTKVNSQLPPVFRQQTTDNGLPFGVRVAQTVDLEQLSLASR